jgi:hypothetical protein
LRIEYFQRLFAGMNLGNSGSMALMLSDGTMLMRRPYDPKIIGINLTGTPNYTRFTKQDSGEFFGTAAIDGVERWYAFRHIDGFPLLLDVAISTRDIYAGWRRRAWIIGSLIGALDVTIIALAILFSQQLRRRLEAEETLRALARTDGLTGLNNRRTFEEQAERAWLQMQRTGRPLSILLIDVDNFKGFNDLYGHSAGDDALVAVARCIDSNAAARYRQPRRRANRRADPRGRTGARVAPRRQCTPCADYQCWHRQYGESSLRHLSGARQRLGYRALRGQGRGAQSQPLVPGRGAGSQPRNDHATGPLAGRRGITGSHEPRHHLRQEILPG